MDFFTRRRFRPVPLTEVSLAYFKGQLVSRLPIHARHQLNDETYGYVKIVIVTPNIYSRLQIFQSDNIQSTGQKSPCLLRSKTFSQRYAFTKQSDTTCYAQYLNKI